MGDCWADFRIDPICERGILQFFCSEDDTELMIRTSPIFPLNLSALVPSWLYVESRSSLIYPRILKSAVN